MFDLTGMTALVSIAVVASTAVVAEMAGVDWSVLVPLAVSIGMPAGWLALLTRALIFAIAAVLTVAVAAVSVVSVRVTPAGLSFAQPLSIENRIGFRLCSGQAG